MHNNSLFSRSAYLTTAIISLYCILIYLYQKYVFDTWPGSYLSLEEFRMLGNGSHIFRSCLLLFSLFMLIYVFVMAAAQVFPVAPLTAVTAFCCLLFFCFVQIGLRSVELFMLQTNLFDFIQIANIKNYKSVMDQVEHFRHIQGALFKGIYIAQLVSGILLAIRIPRDRKVNILLRIAFGMYALHAFLWLFTLTDKYNIFIDLNMEPFWPLLVITFSLILAWSVSMYRTNTRESETQ